MRPPGRLDPLHLQVELRARLRTVGDAQKAVIAGLRQVVEAFGRAEATAAILLPGQSSAQTIFSSPAGASWDAELLTSYLKGARPQIPSGVLLAPVRRRGRSWAVVALRDRGLQSGGDHRRALFAAAEVLTDIVEAVDAKRLHEVRRHIEHRIADRDEPKDIIYDLLHGLRSLTRYDHSAAFLLKSPDGQLKLTAEQIAWTKAKSKKIGTALACDPRVDAELRAGGVQLYTRGDGSWTHALSDEEAALPALLTAQLSSAGAPPEVDMICAPISTPEGPFAVLKVSARLSGVLGEYEARQVEQLMPLASIAIHFAMRAENLRERMLRSERKHALANLTRGISHDVNNALGAMLPLVQQLQQDARAGQLDPASVSDDLAHVERSIQTCRRIFGGMLDIARGARQGLGHGNLRRAVDEALTLLDDSLRRGRVEVVVELPDELPAVRGGQGDLAQLFLNLCSNARDAMPGGGELRIALTNVPGAVIAVVSDTGVGISSADLDRVQEPFFTTKEDGNGLGLSICRSIMWDVGGEMEIDSLEHRGTRLTLRFPVLAERSGESNA